MKFLKKINFDAKAIIQELRDLNDSLTEEFVNSGYDMGVLNDGKA